MMNNDCPNCRHLSFYDVDTPEGQVSVDSCDIYMDNEGPDGHCSRFEPRTDQQQAIECLKNRS